MYDWMAYLTAAKTALDTLKGIKDLLPKGEAADKAQTELDKAEQELEVSKAELAKGFGFRLCRCKLPPRIMLWDNNQRTNVCPECGNTYPPKLKIEPLKSGLR